MSKINFMLSSVEHENVLLPTIVGILTFMSKINFMLSSVEHENVLLPTIVRN